MPGRSGGPLGNVLFVIGIGMWWFFACRGILFLDILIAGLLVIAGAQMLWAGAILKHVEVDGEDLVVSGLKGSVRIARADVLEIRHNPKLKPRCPSVLVVRGSGGEPRMIRFIPAAPREESIARLRALFAGIGG